MSEAIASLFHWRRDIEVDIRIIMRSEGLTDLSLAACKTWARQFIQQQVPWWKPGTPLRWAEEQAVGAAFEGLLAHAKRERDKLAWQMVPNTTRGRRGK